MIGIAVTCKAKDLKSTLEDSILEVIHRDLGKLCAVNERPQWLRPIPYVLANRGARVTVSGALPEAHEPLRLLLDEAINGGSR